MPPTQADERKKIIALIVAIGVVALVGLYYWLPRISGSPSGTNTPAATGGTQSPGISFNSSSDGTQVASAQSNDPNAPKAGPGQVRYFVDEFDKDPPPNTTPEIPATANAGAFKAIKAPAIVVPTPHPTPHTDNKVGRGDPGTGIPGWPIGAKTDMAPVKPMPTPAEVKLDGVFTGPDGFAMLTIRHGTGSTDETLYRRVGEKIEDYTIMAITETGLRLKGFSRNWAVGETLAFHTPAPQVPAMSPGLVRPSPNSPVLEPAARPTGRS